MRHAKNKSADSANLRIIYNDKYKGISREYTRECYFCFKKCVKTLNNEERGKIC